MPASEPALGREPRLHFHWSLPATGFADARKGAHDKKTVNPVSDLDDQRAFCQRAEALGIESLLLPIGFQRADPTVLATAYGLATRTIKFMTASRPGVISPTHFVQQVNTVSAFIGGRIEINVVSGQGSEEMRYYGDWSTHDERYQRTDEFWTVCHALWKREFPVSFDGTFIKIQGARVNQRYLAPDRDRPYVFIGGSSEQAGRLAIKHADCLIRLAEPPAELAPKIEPALRAGIEVGIICNLLARPTHEDALAQAHWFASNAGDGGRAVQTEWRRMTSDSVGFSALYRMAEDRSHWLTPYLWTGLVPYMGPPSISLVGDPSEITEAIYEYRRIGVTRFLFQSRMDNESLELFGGTILPGIRQGESQRPVGSGARGGQQA